ncbi:MAG: RidA family protein [Acidimicrobiia bacterium]
MTDTAATSPGIPLSPFRRAGDLVFVSGQIALRDGVVTGADIGEQTAITMQNVLGVVESAGGTVASIRKVNAILTERSAFAGFNAAYAAAFPAGVAVPARTTIVAGLPNPDALVEIEAIAEVPSG